MGDLFVCWYEEVMGEFVYYCKNTWTAVRLISQAYKVHCRFEAWLLHIAKTVYDGLACSADFVDSLLLWSLHQNCIGR